MTKDRSAAKKAAIKNLRALRRKATVNPDNYGEYLPMDDARYLRELDDWFNSVSAARKKGSR